MTLNLTAVIITGIICATLVIIYWLGKNNRDNLK